jgi:CLIP-associating protein 1/2
MILRYDNQVLFKLVVITVLVIAESADNCIKTVILTFFALLFFFTFSHSMCFPPLILFAFQMLRNCKVVRVLPRIADCAKNDRSAILRARYDCHFFYRI